MKTFERRQLREAIALAETGEQALHMMSGSFAYLRPDTPSCFKGRREIAHLFDQDRPRLIATARRLGVRVIKVERDGEPGQHIDLCGKPLERAQEIAKQDEWEAQHGLSVPSVLSVVNPPPSAD